MDTRQFYPRNYVGVFPLKTLQSIFLRNNKYIFVLVRIIVDENYTFYMIKYYGLMAWLE